MLPDGLSDTGMPRPTRRDPLQPRYPRLIRPIAGWRKDDRFQPFLIVNIKNGVVLNEMSRIWPGVKEGAKLRNAVLLARYGQPSSPNGNPPTWGRAAAGSSGHRRDDAGLCYTSGEESTSKRPGDPATDSPPAGRTTGAASGCDPVYRLHALWVRGTAWRWWRSGGDIRGERFGFWMESVPQALCWGRRRVRVVILD